MALDARAAVDMPERAAASLAAFGLEALGGLAWLRSRRPLARNPAPLRLRFELRMPSGAPIPRVTLITNRNTMPTDLEPPQPVPEGTLIAGEVDLNFRTRHRRLEPTGTDAATLRVSLPLSAASPPGDWSAWRELTPRMRPRWQVED